MPFKFEKDAVEPQEEPDGKYTYVFKHVPSGNKMEVSANCTNESWNGVRYRKGNQWKEWKCLGRKDVLEYLMDTGDHPDYDTASNRITGDHPAIFAARKPEVVEAWEGLNE